MIWDRKSGILLVLYRDKIGIANCENLVIFKFQNSKVDLKGNFVHN